VAPVTLAVPAAIAGLSVMAAAEATDETDARPI